MPVCIQCGKKTKRSNSIYYSNRCQLDSQYDRYIRAWKAGEVNGSRGLSAKNISGHIRRYLSEKYEDGCSICAWKERNPTTGKIPLEIDHVDGNADNNREDNLRLVCPNCHSLTANFRNLSKGKGRDWRRIKYLKSN